MLRYIWIRELTSTLTSVYILIFLVGRYKLLPLVSLNHQLRSKTTSSRDLEQAFKKLPLSGVRSKLDLEFLFLRYGRKPGGIIYIL